MKFLPKCRRSLRLGLLVLAASLSTACVSLFPGEGVPTQVWYELKDLRPSQAGTGPAASTAAKERTLLIGPVASTAFFDGNRLAFSADGHTRGYYQFAAWTDRPAKRLGALVEKRLADSGRFASVAQSTSGIRGQLLLNITLEQCLHDASAEPGQARIGFTAELIDWRSRGLIARRTFNGAAAVSQANALAAVNGLSHALTGQLDELTSWIDSALQDMPATR